MSTMPQSVVVREVTAEVTADDIAKGASGIHVGHRPTEAQLDSLLRRLRAGKRVFLLEWEGSKVPRGVIIDGKEIAWTQNSMVTSTERKHIGTYERVVEFGGQSGEHHQMIIYV